MLVIRGEGSAIARCMRQLVGENDVVVGCSRGEALPPAADRYLFCQGILFGRSMQEMSEDDVAETLFVNATRVIADCNMLLSTNPVARICIIGSESGFAWSYDDAYAAAKAAVHQYVQTKQLKTPHQQLVCVAPGIIGDAGMTTRRSDKKRLAERAHKHPKRRFIESAEVAALAFHTLYIDRGYLSGIVIRMNGGEHTCRG